MLSGAGCAEGPELQPVSGKVYIDGQPLTVGNVKFVPEGARASWGVLDKNGSFTLSCIERGDGAAPGKHRVQVSALEVVSGNRTKWYAPRKYADFRTSELLVDVGDDLEDVKIELTWAGSPPGKPFVE
jgi:hypothetical protein